MTTQTTEETKAVPKWRILVVESDPQTRADNVYNLERWGYQVFAAQGQGQLLLDDAKELAKRERCQLAVVDMRLLSDDDVSDVSGLDLTPDLWPTESIVVTGFADRPVYSRMAVDKGVLGFFGKEEGPEVLRNAVQDALSRFSNPYPAPEALTKYRTSHPWRVLVVDNDVNRRSYYVDFLTKWGYQVFQTTAKNAAQKARENRCHLALVDLDPNTRVLNNIQDLKPAEVIIMGNSLAPEVWRDAEGKGAIESFNKREGIEKLGELIQAVLDKCGYRNIEIDWHSESDATRLATLMLPNISSVFQEEVGDILRRLFPGAQVLKIDEIGTDRFTESPTTRQHSAILRVYQDDEIRPKTVKLARADQIKREVDHFFLYLESRFSGPNYVRPLRQWVELWNLGGTIYDFVGFDGNERLSLLSEYYFGHGFENISQVLVNLENAWPQQFPRNPSRKTVFGAFQSLMDENWSMRFSSHRAASAGNDYRNFGYLRDVPNPILWLIDRLGLDGDGQIQNDTSPQTEIRLIHGDLHGDSVYVNSDRDVWIVNYERTNYGPMLLDFATLETDILTRMISFQPDQAAFFSLIVTAAAPIDARRPLEAIESILRSPEAYKAFTVVREIREIALRRAGYYDQREYLWCLLLASVDRIISDRPSHDIAQKAFLLAAVICHRLDQWSTPDWPPRSWFPAYDPAVPLWAESPEQSAYELLIQRKHDRWRRVLLRMAAYGGKAIPPDLALEKESLEADLRDLGYEPQSDH